MSVALQLIFTLVISLFYSVRADVVKPALIEISAYTTEAVEIEMRVSVEALLSGINGQYSDTTQAPNAELYDQYRVMSAQDLTAAFDAFHDTLLEGVRLQAGGQTVELAVASVEIPEPGYTQVPRNSVVRLSGTLSRAAQSLTWYYPAAFGDHATRVRQVDPQSDRWHWSPHQWIKSDVPTQPFDLTAVFAKPGAVSIAQTYIASGFEHIIPAGLDHILFVVGIFLIASKLSALLWQVTMFTLAHSVTLALGMYGWVSVAPEIVEPLIALSIAYVAFENLASRRLTRFRLPLVFAFGLLHGLGFASVLSDFGMPRESFTWALVCFNVGVELGQLAVIAACYLLVKRWFRSDQAYRRWVVIPASGVIGAVGLMWFVQRFDAQALLALG